VPTYLYGDSHAFPDGYDFLTELRTFVTAASHALRLAHESDQLEQNLGERAQEHLYAIEAVQTFFEGVRQAIENRAVRSGVPGLISPYAKELLAQVDRLGQQAKQSKASDLDADQVGATTKIRDKRQEMREVIAAYLLGDPLPVLSWALSLNLGGTAPQAQSMVVHPGELTTSFTLDVLGDPTWSRPRKLGEISPGTTVQVGFKKAFLRSSLHPDVHTLDDFFVGDVELGPDSMELHLRRKYDAPRDAYVVTVDVGDKGKILAKVTKGNDKRGEQDAPFTCQGEDIGKLAELAETMRRECAPLLSRKKRLVFAQLDDHDVFERMLVRPLFERIALRMAPVAAEVAKHSPNPSELSLKIERDDGRREELYLRKQELLDMVAPLPPEAQELFEQLAFMPRRKASKPPPAVPPLAVT